MNEDLLSNKQKRISQKYMGKNGIHGIGISRSKNAIRVYIAPGYDKKQKTLLNEIEKEATPFKIIKIEDEQAMIT